MHARSGDAHAAGGRSCTCLLATALLQGMAAAAAVCAARVHPSAAGAAALAAAALALPMAHPVAPPATVSCTSPPQDQGKSKIAFVDVAAPDYDPAQNGGISFEKAMEAS